MSVEAFARVLSVRVGQSTRKLVLMAYANHAHKDGRNTWCSVDTVAEYAECDERTVQRHIAKLLEGGFMREGDQSVPRQVSTKPGEQLPIVYDIAMDDDTMSAWRSVYDPDAGCRARHARAGRVGGQKSAALRRAGGDNLTPPCNPTADLRPAIQAQVSGGDNLTPPSGDRGGGDIAVSPGGVTSDVTGGGDIAVSPEPSLEPSEEPSLFGAELTTSAQHRAASTNGTATSKGRPRIVRSPDEQARFDLADRIAREWWERCQADGPVLGPDPDQSRRGSPFVGLRQSIIYAALEAGATEAEIKYALLDCNVSFPARGRFEEALRARRRGRPDGPRRGTPANVYRDPRTADEQAALSTAFDGPRTAVTP